MHSKHMLAEGGNWRISNLIGFYSMQNLINWIVYLFNRNDLSIWQTITAT